MKALSVKQPWAWLICAGYKDIENRNWKIGRKSQHGPYSSYHQANFAIELPTRICVHTGKGRDIESINMILNSQWDWFPHDALSDIFWMEQNDKWVLGSLIGEVDIVDCITESKSPWFVGKYGFLLKNPMLYEKAIPCKGQLGFFDVETISRVY